jgi:hypothetical protein
VVLCAESHPKLLDCLVPALGKDKNTWDCSIVHCNGNTSVGYLNSSIKLHLWFLKNGNQTTFEVAVFENLRIQRTSGSSFLKNQLLSQNNCPKPGSNWQLHRRFFWPVLRIFKNSGYTSESVLNVLRTTIMYWTNLFDFSDNNDYIALRTMGREPAEYQFPFLITAQHCKGLGTMNE